MSPLIPSFNLDLDAVSGIAGSISIACWVVVFSPQIIENFRRKSADGLSVTFLAIWLAGDVFNILGSVLQGVLVTMLIIAVYYTLADMMLLAQMWWYKSRARRGNKKMDTRLDGEHESTNGQLDGHLPAGQPSSTVHVSSATPLLDESKSNNTSVFDGKPQSAAQVFVFNTFAIVLVCATGVFGWWVSSWHGWHKHDKYNEKHLQGELPKFDTLGQVFGYLCAALYLGSRVPQILLNYRRKSTEGVSLLFFIFACVGNLTYDVSIFAFNPALRCESGPKHCRPGEMGMIYSRHIAVDASWIVGSLGTLFLDMCIFVQFFLYRKIEGDDWDQERSRNEGYGSIS